MTDNFIRVKRECGNSICALLEKARYLKEEVLLLRQIRFKKYEKNVVNAMLEKVERTINDTIEKMEILDKISDYHVFTPREENNAPKETRQQKINLHADSNGGNRTKTR